MRRWLAVPWMYAASTGLRWKSEWSWACFSKRSIVLSIYGRSRACQRPGHIGDDLVPVGAAEERFHAPFGVRHEPEHVAGLVRHAGDVRRAAVRIRLERRRALRVGVAKHHAPTVLQL